MSRTGIGVRSRRHRVWSLLAPLGLALASTLLPTGCSRKHGPGPAGVPPQGRVLSSPPAPAEEGPALARFHRRLQGVRAALDRDGPTQAGRLLLGTLRVLEEDLAGGSKALDREAAETFEEVRRVADRWQAGVAPTGDEAQKAISGLDEQALRLLSDREGTETPRADSSAKATDSGERATPSGSP